MGINMILSIPTMWLFPELFLIYLPMISHSTISKVPTIHFTQQLPFIQAERHGEREHANQVMLTHSDCLITPLHLGSMLVGLNI